MHRAPRVCVVQRALRRYREPFYEQLRRRMDAEGVVLRLVNGEPPDALGARGDLASIPWAVQVQRRDVVVGSGRLVWLDMGRYVRGADLVITEQASGLLHNYSLLARQATTSMRLALWGHGKTYRVGASGASTAVKTWMSRRPDWWFAYTDESAEHVASLGYPRSKITVVNNSTDTRTLRRGIQAVEPERLVQLRDQLGIGAGPVGLYLGNLDQHKNVQYLLTAAARICAAVPSFHLIVAGAGADAEAVDRAAESSAQIHRFGYTTGTMLHTLLAVADVLLVPSGAGLVVVDGFAAGVPLIARVDAGHGPEISYVHDAVNGMLVADGGDAAVYASTVIALLRNGERLAALKQGAREAGDRLSIENMAQRFGDGVLDALSVCSR